MILGREPVMWMAVIQAAIVCAVSFGLNLSTYQEATLLSLSAVVLGWISRSVVSPVTRIK